MSEEKSFWKKLLALLNKRGQAAKKGGYGKYKD